MTTTTARPRLTEEPVSDFDAMTPPHDLEAENALVASMIVNDHCIGPLVGVLAPEDFWDDRNAALCRVLFAVWDKTHAIDAVILHAELVKAGQLENVGGMDRILEICRVQGKGTAGLNAAYYGAIVLNLAKKRRLMTMGWKIMQAAGDPSTDAQELETKALGLVYDATKAKEITGNASISDAMAQMAEAMERAQAGELGLPTGLSGLDRMLGGMEGGELIIVGARPSHGKTAFLTTIIDTIASVYKKRCLFFSSEMPKVQIARRFVCARANVSLAAVRRGFINKEEAARIGAAVREFLALEDLILIDDTSNIPLSRLRSTAFQHASKQRIDFIGIDYCQLIAPPELSKSATRAQEVGAISRGIKGLARDLKVPVMLLAQLNRAAENRDGLPKLSDLRESGDLEQDADAVLLLHREWKARENDPSWRIENTNLEHWAQVLVAKQRNGETGVCELSYIGDYTRFEDWNPGV